VFEPTSHGVASFVVKYNTLLTGLMILFMLQLDPDHTVDSVGEIFICVTIFLSRRAAMRAASLQTLAIRHRQDSRVMAATLHVRAQGQGLEVHVEDGTVDVGLVDADLTVETAGRSRTESSVSVVGGRQDD
jgi:hypothetical protein